MIELWLTRTDTADIERLQDDYLAMLAPEEAQRAARLRHPGVRAEFLTARALARVALSDATGEELAGWRFTIGDHGKPAIETPPCAGLEFNLSHTHGLVACAVRRGGVIGIDAEDCLRHNGGIELARRFFARGEVAALEKTAEEDRRAVFFRFWTLKESFIKARGRGMSLPLDRFAFTLSPDSPPRIDFAPDGETTPQEWQFAELRLGMRHQIAVCAHQSPREPLLIRIRQAVPLAWQETPRLLPASALHCWTI